MPGRVPDRWEEYQPFKEAVKGTRFIAFKVPLEEAICRRVELPLHFTPQHLVDQMRNCGMKLGLVIDLTNTARYYKPWELENQGVQYTKLNTEGHEVPNMEVQRKFMRIVDEYIASVADTDTLIGVHCTHGVNRTGYLICRYMIDKLKFGPEEAIQAFKDARGYGIERANYLADLQGKPAPAADHGKHHGGRRRSPIKSPPQVSSHAPDPRYIYCNQWHSGPQHQFPTHELRRDSNRDQDERCVHRTAHCGQAGGPTRERHNRPDGRPYRRPDHGAQQNPGAAQRYEAYYPEPHAGYKDRRGPDERYPQANTHRQRTYHNQDTRGYAEPPTNYSRRDAYPQTNSYSVNNRAYGQYGANHANNTYVKEDTPVMPHRSRSARNNRT